MSYTIPDHVDTNAQAILVIASAVKDEAVNATDGTVRGALDALGDALAGHDIDVPQTSNGAILALAQYVSGGGGVTLGPQTPVAYPASATMPEIGDGVASLTYLYDAAILSVGDVTIADCSENSGTIDSTGGFAAGVTITTLWMPAYGTDAGDAAHAFLFTTENIGGDDFIKTITEVPDAVTMETDDASQKRYTFTVPAVPDGQYFGICYAGNWD